MFIFGLTITLNYLISKIILKMLKVQTQVYYSALSGNAKNVMHTWVVL